MTTVHFVVPDGIDDPARPSGGNTYDRHLCRGLASAGWSVYEHPVASRAALGPTVARIPDDAVVLIDGLIASPAPEVLVSQASRLRLVVLMHMPICDEPEGAVLSAATAVVTTSAWARGRLLETHGLSPHRVHVAEPGVEAAAVASGSDGGGALLCVAAVIPGKGHDLLLDALTTIGDLPWHCTCVGSLDRDPVFAARLRHDRVDFLGPRTGAALDRCYASADLLVLPSRSEAYGMVVTEALSRGIPVVATDVGGVREALGHGGVLVPPDDPAALGAALRAWLSDAELRRRLRRAACERRESLGRWSTTASVVADVLAGAAR